MTQEVKIIIGITIATLVIIFGGVFLLSKKEIPESPAASPADQNMLLRNAKHKKEAAAAKATLVEFADFQCPACAKAHPFVNQLVEKYKENVTFVYRHFPLPQHKNAILASRVSEAAAAQGKFWQMYDLLYQKQSEWSESENAKEIFTRYAEESKLDTTKFSEGLASDTFDSLIQGDKNDGVALGVNSTPTFFLNGKKLTLNSFSDLSKYIDQELKK